jgi:hypothetical protein
LWKLASIAGSVVISRLRPPPFSGTAGVQLRFAFQLAQALPDGLGVASQERRDVLDPAVAELGGLDGRIPTPIALLERVEEPLH